jgi:hypothetical protein
MVRWDAGSSPSEIGKGTTMSKTLYMLIEHYKNGDAAPIYRQFRDHGRLAPEGLSYVSSWVDTKLELVIS